MMIFIANNDYGSFTSVCPNSVRGCDSRCDCGQWAAAPRAELLQLAALQGDRGEHLRRALLAQEALHGDARRGALHPGALAEEQVVVHVIIWIPFSIAYQLIVKWNFK